MNNSIIYGNDDQNDSNVDYYETVDDYVLLETVRDAIEDIEPQINNIHNKCHKPLSNELHNKVINKMKATSNHTKERIKAAIAEIKAQEAIHVCF